MVDIVSKEIRSRMMAGIRSGNTKPEILTRKALHKLGYRYRLGSKVSRVKPDIVLVKHKVAVFVHGCYWHKHAGCKFAYADRNYSSKWQEKFSKNSQRDIKVNKELINQGWRVAVFWECATRNNKILKAEIMKLDSWIRRGSNEYFEVAYREN